MSGTRSSNPWDVYNSALGADGHAAPSTASSHQTLSSPSALPFLLTFSSPSSSTSSSSVPSSVSRTNRSPASSRRSSVDTTPRVKTCSNCGTLTTPLWRRNRETNQPLCNACGLYLQLRSKMRPAALIAADLADDEAAVPGAPQCFNCHAQSTSVWRRSKTGAKLCNACGLYARLRGRDRPLSLNRNKIRPRGRHPQT
ncbi:hypothetical protein B0H15DRAFT_792889 [Mycena belliarum]|uniref:GATA-type domain-containing protein n=1 Tax=Mycena belliarum TaxID=1033014 RepID=A0AAD6XEH8_9AGAR|nr:hypothetical protein B0H15DRAFT_792889 [Mycena belliae]